MKSHHYRDNVFVCYNQLQDCVECDGVLLAFYENYFGKLGHQGVSSVKRAGRYWRQKGSFRRSIAKREADFLHTQEVKRTYGVIA